MEGKKHTIEDGGDKARLKFIEEKWDLGSLGKVHLRGFSLE